MDELSGADREVTRIMDVASSDLLAAPDNAYQICLETCAPLTNQPLFSAARHASTAFVMWALISDLQDDHRGPQSADLCKSVAAEVAQRWQRVDHDTQVAIDHFFAQAKELVDAAFSSKT
jgi:hypothetical protein